VMTSVSEPDLLTLGYIIYPNPASGNLFLQIKNIIPGKYFITIVNPAGQIHFHKEIVIPDMVHTEQFDLSGLAKGKYFITVSGGSQAISQTLILQ
jgi:hypothetical protein